MANLAFVALSAVDANGTTTFSSTAPFESGISALGLLELAFIEGKTATQAEAPLPLRFRVSPTADVPPG